MTEEQKRRAEIEKGFRQALDACDLDFPEFLGSLADWLHSNGHLAYSGVDRMILVALREKAGEGE